MPDIPCCNWWLENHVVFDNGKRSDGECFGYGSCSEGYGKIDENTRRVPEGWNESKIEWLPKSKSKRISAFDKYSEGDKVWYQHQDLNAWLGLAEVIFP